jgi:hypothetical protein
MCNLQISISKLSARAKWGLRRGQEIESWGDGIHLLDDWGYFNRSEPRLDHIRWVRHIQRVGIMPRIYHFQLGEAAG